MRDESRTTTSRASGWTRLAQVRLNPSGCVVVSRARTWRRRRQTGAELDLLIVAGGKRFGFEFKYSEAPTVTPSMRIALENLKLDTLDVIHAGSHTFPMGERIRGVALGRLLTDLHPLT